MPPPSMGGSSNMEWGQATGENRCVGSEALPQSGRAPAQHAKKKERGCRWAMIRAEAKRQSSGKSHQNLKWACKMTINDKTSGRKGMSAMNCEHTGEEFTFSL
eukprot:EG_transcript_28632